MKYSFKIPWTFLHSYNTFKIRVHTYNLRLCVKWVHWEKSEAYYGLVSEGKHFFITFMSVSNLTEEKRDFI